MEPLKFKLVFSKLWNALGPQESRLSLSLMQFAMLLFALCSHCLQMCIQHTTILFSYVDLRRGSQELGRVYWWRLEEDTELTWSGGENHPCALGHPLRLETARNHSPYHCCSYLEKEILLVSIGVMSLKGYLVVNGECLKVKVSNFSCQVLLYSSNIH